MSDDPATDTGATSPQPSTQSKILGGAGLLLHCTLIAFIYLSTGLVAPLYALLVLFVVWAALLYVGVRWFRGGKPALALAIPFIALAVWLAVLSLGGTLLDWTA